MVLPFSLWGTRPVWRDASRPIRWTKSGLRVAHRAGRLVEELGRRSIRRSKARQSRRTCLRTRYLEILGSSPYFHTQDHRAALQGKFIFLEYSLTSVARVSHRPARASSTRYPRPCDMVVSPSNPSKIIRTPCLLAGSYKPQLRYRFPAPWASSSCQNTRSRSVKGSPDPHVSGAAQSCPGLKPHFGRSARRTELPCQRWLRTCVIDYLPFPQVVSAPHR